MTPVPAGGSQAEVVTVNTEVTVVVTMTGAMKESPNAAGDRVLHISVC